MGVTFVTADGETELGELSEAVTVADKTINGQIAVSDISLGGAAVTARKVYLVPVDGSRAKHAATIADNVTTSTTLNTADADLGADAPSTNTTEDPILGQLRSAARERGEFATGRGFIEQTWDYKRDAFPCEDFIEIPRPPLLRVTSVNYVDENGTTQTLSIDDYAVLAPSGPKAARGRVALKYGKSWPSTRCQAEAVTVRFVAGYGDSGADVPGLLRQAMLLDVATLYAQRENVVTGTIVQPVPNGSTAIYRSFRSHATQQVA